MTYEMKLQSGPFAAIKAGEKTVEMRLNDEKRRILRIGDRIRFTDMATGEALLCEIRALYPYKNFEELYARHDKRTIGYKNQEIADPKDMLAYYPQEKIDLYGVLGIEIQIIKGMEE